jgi:hypothetical protein
MIKIFKYKIPVESRVELSLPVGYKILSVKNQCDQIVLYAQVNAYEKRLSLVVISVVGTGNELLFKPDNYEYVDSVLTNGDRFAWHVFREKR